MAIVREVLQGRIGEVWTIQPQATVHSALQLMADHNVGALPVVENGEVIGIFSERDYARKVGLKDKPPRITSIREVMSQPVIWISPDETIETCMEMMTTRRVRHLPVFEGTRLIGMVSSGDVLKAIIDNQQMLIQDLHNFIVGGRS